MSLPVQFKSLAFWKAVSFLLVGIAALLVVFNVIPANYGLDAGAILSAILTVLHFFDITPELQAKGLMKPKSDG